MSPGPEESVPVIGEGFADHRPALLRPCYRMLGSFEEAEDVVQEVLLRTWRQCDTHAGDVPVSHWLMRITTSACLNALARGRQLLLPQLDRSPAALGTPFETLEEASWITPAQTEQRGCSRTRRAPPSYERRWLWRSSPSCSGLSRRSERSNR